jgi:predicted permease
VPRPIQDIRYTLRQLAKSPAFTIVSVLTIALGIGANAAIFSVMNAVLLRFLPVSNPQQLVFFHLRNQPLSTSQTGYGDLSMSLPVFEAMRGRRDVFSDVIAFAPLAFDKVAVRVGAAPEEANGELVSGNYFPALGVQPVLGRAFTAQDESSHASVAVLSFAYWNRQFAAAPDVLGRTFYVKGIAFTVVGVAPAGFQGTDPGQPAMDFWVPLQQRPELNPFGTPPTDHTLYGSPEWLSLVMVGRLRPGVSAQQAASQLAAPFRTALANASPAGAHEPKPELFFSDVRGVENLREDYEHPLHFLMAMVGVILLIACANVALLLIARNAGRRREFGLRQALGAGRRALFQQLLLESLALVTAGSALGWLFAGSATQALSAWSGIGILIEPDGTVLWLTLAVSAAVAVLFGLAPLRTVSRVPLNVAMKSAAATSHTDPSRLWGRKLVIALQISLCTVLLFAAGLLYRTLRNLESRDLGMRTGGLLVFGIEPQSGIRSDADAIRFHTALLERLRALPGVDSATVMQTRLGSGVSSNDGVLVDGRNPLPARPFAPMRVNLVGSAFLRTLGIPLRLGRDIADSDTATSLRVTIVNQTFAERYLPGVGPLGHRIRFFTGKTDYVIVGVAANSRYTSIDETDRPVAYFPFTQVSGISDMQYELHTPGDPKMLISECAKLVHQADPNLPLRKPATQEAEFRQSVAQERLVANLSMFFGGLAAFLIAIGIYGTISYSIGRRTMEIGVRMALGAERREVLWMVLSESLAVAAAGLAVGVPASLAVARTLRSMLYGLGSGDLVTLLLALAGIVAVTLAAAILPARRAASTDPIRALRME